MLEDVWRIKNPCERMYTYIKHNPQYSASRINYFLINYRVMSNTVVGIEPGCATDHSLITLTIDTNTPPRGKGIWRLNTSHLCDSSYISAINNAIDDCIFSFTKQHQHDERWEMIKDTLASVSNKFSRQKARENKNNLQNLLSTLDTLNQQINNSVDPIVIQEYSRNIEKVSNRIEQHYDRITKGAMIRSRSKWYLEASTNSKFFLNLEKIKYSNKTMKYLIGMDNTVIRDHKKILQEKFKYYKKLYSSDPDVHFSYENNTENKLSDDKKFMLDQRPTLSEVAEVVRSMSNDKCCGIDGLPIEIYQVFFNKIGIYLYNAIIYAIETKGFFHLSARRGVLSLIPKKHKSPEY